MPKSVLSHRVSHGLLRQLNPSMIKYGLLVYRYYINNSVVATRCINTIIKYLPSAFSLFRSGGFDPFIKDWLL